MSRNTVNIKNNVYCRINFYSEPSIKVVIFLFRYNTSFVCECKCVRACVCLCVFVLLFLFCLKIFFEPKYWVCIYPYNIYTKKTCRLPRCPTCCNLSEVLVHHTLSQAQLLTSHIKEFPFVFLVFPSYLLYTIHVNLYFPFFLYFFAQCVSVWLKCKTKRCNCVPDN